MIQSRINNNEIDDIMKTNNADAASHKNSDLEKAKDSTDPEYKAAAISHYLNQDDNSKKPKYHYSSIFAYDDGFPMQHKFDPIDQHVSVDKNTYPTFVAEVLGSIKESYKQQDFLIAVIKQVYKHPNGAAYIEKIGEIPGFEKIRAAEIIIEATKGINLKDKHYTHSRDAIEKLYDDKVRGEEGKAVKLDKFDELMKVMHPEEFGKMLFSEKKKENEHRLPKGLSNDHLEEFKEAATALKDHANASRHTPNQDKKSVAVDNLLSNLSREQVAYIVKAVKSNEDFNKKDWLSQKLSNFIDAVQKLFNKEISNDVVKAGVKQIIEEGAKIGSPSKMTAVDRLKQSDNRDKGQAIQK